jgi:hypothetical protein
MTRTMRVLATLTIALVVGLNGLPVALAFDRTYTRTMASDYAFTGVKERYVLGGSKWRNNDIWDADEGADCSGYAAKAWAVEHYTSIGTTYHPYSTANFYNTYTYWYVKTDRTIANFVQIWVFLQSSGGPSNHMGLFRTRNSDGTWTTYEARGKAYGIVINTRSLSTLISWNYHRVERKYWGG